MRDGDTGPSADVPVVGEGLAVKSPEGRAFLRGQLTPDEPVIPGPIIATHPEQPMAASRYIEMIEYHGEPQWISVVGSVSRRAWEGLETPVLRNLSYRPYPVERRTPVGRDADAAMTLFPPVVLSAATKPIALSLTPAERSAEDLVENRDTVLEISGLELWRTATGMGGKLFSDVGFVTTVEVPLLTLPMQEWLTNTLRRVAVRSVLRSAPERSL
ncbi:MAG: hypothetical protein LBE60_11755 [Microbacterium sp.]|jgi:hypothetical protein|uniref:hypothetical protein n=1 Tax=Microbacterium sp. TaxID=51671 RepID=UPI0028184FAF|nr:hypothetical protein [Microbacterium sp.]MDR2322307.1 hypothetical protein [Microbacterium sp.]